MATTWGFEKPTLKIETSDGRNVTLLEVLRYTTKSGELIEAPIGTSSDGASTPKWMWNLIPPFGSYWLAAVLHDYLYRLTQKPKDYCDDIILEAMESLGVDLILREAIYEGVHLAGDIAFNDDRRVKLKLYLGDLAFKMAQSPLQLMPLMLNANLGGIAQSRALGLHPRG
jgi:hypothetical protein